MQQVFSKLKHRVYLPCFFLFGKHLRIKSFNGVWGTGMNFPTKANGQLHERAG
jgi:hypothetical protein